MLYLVPGTVIPFLVMAKCRGELDAVWKGNAAVRTTPVAAGGYRMHLDEEGGDAIELTPLTRADGGGSGPDDGHLVLGDAVVPPPAGIAAAPGGSTPGGTGVVSRRTPSPRDPARTVA